MIKVNQYINNQYKEYAKYVVYSRAIPSVMDGLKPGQRKVLFTALKVAKNKKVKTKALGGQTIATANFHHGDASLDAASTLMAGTWNNNAPLLEGEGNFGSRLVNEAGAPRYTFVKMSENFDKYFLDNDILDPQPDPEDPEPLFYLPTIPWVLVNGIQGIAVGFATNILPRQPKDLKEVVTDLLKGKEPKNPLIPSYPKFKGHVEFAVDKDGLSVPGKYLIRGVLSRRSATTVEILELPYGIEREKYLEVLEALKEKGKIVKYIERCDKAGFYFKVTLPNKSKNLKDEAVMKLLKLIKPVTENLTVILEDKKLHKFESPVELIKHFLEVRKSYYVKRYKNKIKVGKAELNWLEAKYEFIKKFVEGVNSIERKTRPELKEYANQVSKKHSAKLMDIKIYNFNEDELASIQKQIKIVEKDIQIWENVDIIAEYTKDLKTIK